MSDGYVFLLTESSDTQNERGEEYEEENELSADPCFNDSIFLMQPISVTAANIPEGKSQQAERINKIQEM